MVLIWGVNGCAQSFGWPCLAKVFMNWFPDPAERGALYSILSTNQNVGSALVPLFLIPTLQYTRQLKASPGGITSWTDQSLVDLDWRIAMVLPCIVGVAYAVVLLLVAKDAPTDTTPKASVAPKGTDTNTSKPPAGKLKLSLKETFRRACFDPVLWQLSVCYFVRVRRASPWQHPL